MRTVAILGATGSIGRSTLDVVRSLGSEYRVVGLSAGSSWRALAEAAAEFRPRRIALADKGAADMLTRELARGAAHGGQVPSRNGTIRPKEPDLRASGSYRSWLDGADVLVGPDAACEVASADDTDVVVSAIVGAAGLEPTLAAVRAGKRVALANKEALVMAGGLVLEEARRSGAEILPVDSEHSAVFQARLAGGREEVRRIILTASGGPFHERGGGDPPAGGELEGVTPEEALRHPTWSMGPKITVDSATLMNKALEIIEARWLFDLDPSQIEVWVHPQSVVHSMVEFVDGSVVAQLGPADMRLPIQYALTYPERVARSSGPFSVEEMGRLTFLRPDEARFPAIGLGYRAAREGGTAGAALSAANEVAVEAFLEGRAGFTDIARAAELALVSRKKVDEPGLATLDDIWEADARARECARACLRSTGPAPGGRPTGRDEDGPCRTRPVRVSPALSAGSKTGLAKSDEGERS